MELVEFIKDEIFCDSLTVSKKFGQKHAYTVRTIKKLHEDLNNLRVIPSNPKIIEEERVYRGTIYNVYLMNREFFTLLSMRFKGIEALEWQVKFNDAFYQMEKRILQNEINGTDKDWIKSRTQLKIGRKEETDVIKKFVEYATDQGSKSAKFYYKHVTNATYKALGLMSQNKPKLRDSMNIYEVSQLILAEREARKLFSQNIWILEGITKTYMNQ